MRAADLIVGAGALLTVAGIATAVVIGSTPVTEEKPPPPGRMSPVAVWELPDGGREFWRMQYLKDGGTDYTQELTQPCEWQPAGTAPLKCGALGTVTNRGGLSTPCAVRMCLATLDAGLQRPARDGGSIIKGGQR